MAASVLLIAAAAAAVGVPTVAAASQSKRRTEPNFQPVPEVLPPPVPVSSEVPQKQGGSPLELLKQAGKVGAGILGAGMVLQHAVAPAIRAAGGTEGQSDLAKILPLQTALGVAGQAAGRALAGAVGASEETQRHAGITGALILAAPPLAAAKLLGDAFTAGLGLVAGKQAEADVRNFVSSFDPTRTDTGIGKAVGAVSSAIGAIFGGGKAPEPSAIDTAAASLADFNARIAAGEVVAAGIYDGGSSAIDAQAEANRLAFESSQTRLASFGLKFPTPGVTT